MCGFHDANGHPIDHLHSHPSDGPPPVKITVRQARAARPAGTGVGGRVGLRSRRAFLGEFGRNTMALAVFTPLAAACASNGAGDQAATTTDATTTDGTTETTAAGDAGPGGSDTDSDADQDTGSGQSPDSASLQDGDLVWGRADLGFVSAFVLARGNSAAIIDTGVAGSAPAIGETLQAMGLNYGDVEHLILTHKHGDHAGSLAAIMDSATNAKVYAGQADLDGIDGSSVDEGIVPLVGGEDVFGLQMVASPGHTAGHMCALDANTGLLVAGDALFTDRGRVIEGSARFFADVPQSQDTIRELATLSYNTLLVGHGDPIEGDASAAVAQLADSLP